MSTPWLSLSLAHQWAKDAGFNQFPGPQTLSRLPALLRHSPHASPSLPPSDTPSLCPALSLPHLHTNEATGEATSSPRDRLGARARLGTRRGSRLLEVPGLGHPNGQQQQEDFHVGAGSHGSLQGGEYATWEQSLGKLNWETCSQQEASLQHGPMGWLPVAEMDVSAIVSGRGLDQLLRFCCELSPL